MKTLILIATLLVTFNVNAMTISETAAQRAITSAMKNDHLTTFRTNSMVQTATRRFNGKIILQLERVRIDTGWSQWDRVK